MKKIHRNTLLALVMALVLTFMSAPTIAKAGIPSEETYSGYLNGEPIVHTYSGYVNGVERTVVLTLDTFGLSTYLKIGESDFENIAICSTDCGPDRYSAIWNLTDTLLGFWSYDLTPDFDSIVFSIYRNDVESLMYEDPETRSRVIGYKTLSGEICTLPTFDDMKFTIGADDSIPEPFYGSFPDSTPPPKETPSLSPTPVPVVTATPVPTVKPTVTPKPKATSLSVKKSKSKSIMYQGDTIISKLTLKEGTLTWNRQGKKTKRYKGVKDAALILKSKNAVYVTKKGAAYTVSYKNGKKKRIVKKGAKKILCTKGSAVKIKLTSGKTKSIKNK